MSDETPSLDKLCKAYVNIRNKKQEVTKQLETQIAEYDEKLNLIAGAMKDALIAAGGTSLKTPHGTIYMVKKTKYYPMDWGRFGEWIVQNNAVELLEKRVSQSNMKQYLEDNPHNPPPGLQSEVENSVTVRKA